MVRVQSGSETEGGYQSDGGFAAPDEPAAAFPPTYMVLVFSSTISNEAFVWLLDKIRGKRRNGGAELLLRRQPHKLGQGVTLHVSASKIKFLEVAEELELKKRDREGLVREFAVAQMEEFLADGMHVDDLLTTAERQHIVRHELENIRALAEDDHVPGHDGLVLYEGQSIIQACLHWGLMDQMYPLHDTETLNNFGRKWYWALFRKQPIEEIRLYFGEAVALYFSFLGFYTTALIVPMALGFLQLFMSTGTVAFFCMFNVLWVTVFLEVWKRKCSELAFSWGTIGMTSLDDDPRPNYHGQMAVDPVTGRFQPQFPRWKTNARLYLVSLPLVLLCMAGAFGVMLASFWAEEYLAALRRARGLRAGALIALLPSVVYTALVFLMNLYYRRLATHLTEWENHRTQTQFDRHRVTKLVLFEFVNNFMSLFYIAFYIQDMDMLKSQLAIMLIVLQAIQNFQEAVLPLLIKYYGSTVTRWLGYLTFEQLRAFEGGGGGGNGKGDPADERAPLLHPAPLEQRTWDQEKELQALLKDVPQLDADDPRIEPAIREGEMERYEGTYDDYLEMFVQFGYVFLFSSVYPMAAFWAVVNNVLEIRADAFKLCRVFQRPMAKRVKDIGAWQRAFEALGAMSVMTNCGLLATSPELRHLRPDVGAVEWVLLFVALEHALLGVRYVLHKAIPEKPEWVRVALAKINHQSKRALKNEVRPRSLPPCLAALYPRSRSPEPAPRPPQKPPSPTPEESPPTPLSASDHSTSQPISAPPPPNPQLARPTLSPFLAGYKPPQMASSPPVDSSNASPPTLLSESLSAMDTFPDPISSTLTSQLAHSLHFSPFLTGYKPPTLPQTPPSTPVTEDPPISSPIPNLPRPIPFSLTLSGYKASPPPPADSLTEPSTPPPTSSTPGDASSPSASAPEPVQDLPSALSSETVQTQLAPSNAEEGLPEETQQVPLPQRLPRWPDELASPPALRHRPPKLPRFGRRGVPGLIKRFESHSFDSEEDA